MRLASAAVPGAPPAADRAGGRLGAGGQARPRRGPLLQVIARTAGSCRITAWPGNAGQRGPVGNGENIVNGMVVLMVVVPFLLAAACFGPSYLLALKRNRELAASAPETLTYTWGYFLGYSGIGSGLFIVLAGLVLIVVGRYVAWSWLAVLYGVGLAIASYGVLTRTRWGWLVHIPLSLNMGLWAFNSVYFSNRWRELPWR